MSDDVRDLLADIEKAAEVEANATYRAMDNHLLHSDRVIANQAALDTANGHTLELLKALSENPTLQGSRGS